MKSINDLYQEVISDENLRKKFLAAYTNGNINDFLKENGCEASAEEALKFIEQETHTGSYELSDEELALVVGGEKGIITSDAKPKYEVGDLVCCNSPFKNRPSLHWVNARIIQHKGFSDQYFQYRARTEGRPIDGHEFDLSEHDISYKI